MRFRTFFFASSCLLSSAACQKDAPPQTAEPAPTQSASPPAAKAAPLAVSATPSAVTPAASALSADSSGVLALSWKVANAPDEHVTVSLVAGSETIRIGSLDATSDDQPGTVATCATKSTPTSTKLECGGTPHYNFYTAKIANGALVVTLTDGVDNDPPGSEKVTEILRRPTTATSLRATGPASPALYGNCRPGFVQKTSDAPCMRQCLKGTECKGDEKCAFVTVKGNDGDHKVHACVPPGK